MKETYSQTQFPEFAFFWPIKNKWLIHCNHTLTNKYIPKYISQETPPSDWWRRRRSSSAIWAFSIPTKPLSGKWPPCCIAINHWPMHKTCKRPIVAAHKPRLNGPRTRRLAWPFWNWSTSCARRASPLGPTAPTRIRRPPSPSCRPLGWALRALYAPLPPRNGTNVRSWSQCSRATSK